MGIPAAEDIAQPEFTGVRVLEDFPLATLRAFIDWSPFFHTWELRGRYPAIFEHEKYGEQARKVFDDAQELLDKIIDEKLLTARAVYGLFPARRGNGFNSRQANRPATSARISIPISLWMKMSAIFFWLKPTSGRLTI